MLWAKILNTKLEVLFDNSKVKNEKGSLIKLKCFK